MRSRPTRTPSASTPTSAAAEATPSSRRWGTRRGSRSGPRCSSPARPTACGSIFPRAACSPCRSIASRRAPARCGSSCVPRCCEPMKIYTRTGDEGETGLFGGGRVPKDHARVAAYGDVDELNSTIGLVRATPPVQFYDAELAAIQRDLFAIGGHLATPDLAKVAAALEKATLSVKRVD